MTRTPKYVLALLDALCIREPRPESLYRLNNNEWAALLSFCDSMHLTLVVAELCDEFLPPWVRARIAQNRSDNATRFVRLITAYEEMAAAFRRHGADHLVLKGFAQWPGYGRDLRLRMQSDIDIFCPPDSIAPARDALVGLGYEPLPGVEETYSDHLPTMVRKTGWTWRGNVFDPDMPFSVDLHFCFWNRERLRFGSEELNEFWNRRVVAQVASLEVPALHPIDCVGYSALHALRHLLCGGGLLTFHIYEIASFLNTTANHGSFWDNWRTSHHFSLRRLETIIACLAEDWFHCRLAEALLEQDCSPSQEVQQWLNHSARACLDVPLRLDKSSLWLHLSLIDSPAAKRAVLRQALLPTRIPSIEAFYIQGDPQHPTRNQSPLARRSRYLVYLLSRTAYHLKILVPTVLQGLRWWYGAWRPRRS